MFDASPMAAVPEPVVTPARDPLVDRARAIYLYVVAGIALQEGVVNSWAAIFGRPVKAMSLAELGVIVSPAIVYMFGKSLEQWRKAKAPPVTGGNP